MKDRLKSAKNIIRIYTGFFSILYWVLKLLPTKSNKVLFMSRQTENPSVDFRMLKNCLLAKDNDLKIVMLNRRVKKNMTDVLFKNTPMMFRQIYHLATSRVCIVDGYNIAVSVLNHKPELKIIQIWHSLGAIKKFGRQSLNDNYSRSVAESLRMHKNYDIIISASKNSVDYFAEAFGYDKKMFKICGLPRVDYLKNNSTNNREKILKKYPELAKRLNIIYAPTFRDGKCVEMEKLIRAIDTDKFNLIVRLHPNTKLKYSRSGNILECNEFSFLQLLSIADYVVTDYSAVSLEAAILNIPVYIYAYDLEKYQQRPGLNIDLKSEFPGYVFDDAHKLADKIANGRYRRQVVRNYVDKYIEYNDSKNTDRLANIILGAMKHA